MDKGRTQPTRLNDPKRASAPIQLFGNVTTCPDPQHERRLPKLKSRAALSLGHPRRSGVRAFSFRLRGPDPEWPPTRGSVNGAQGGGVRPNQAV